MRDYVLLMNKCYFGIVKLGRKPAMTTLTSLARFVLFAVSHGCAMLGTNELCHWSERQTRVPIEC